jgi:hypothetical protein
MLKNVPTKSYMQSNRVMPFEPHEPHVTLVEYEKYLRLFIFYYLDKNPRWVTNCYGNADY